ncbi:acyl-CoA hydrolase [Pullulanibacillus pueri]|uniref:Putative acyl-CoA thioester hydrolase YkhA n=1 Tax=Pullulanibacillus pueri TaxID=1437324 RepID=A0A8J2ZTG1_9BACL|nr:acyl-CoA thioesterase [Pullulanibacillus pueri]MBM7681876.1 acyl-CoA hydrolase [Pullulanibacillus pueri]GGH76436.1 putative acyl-CoA thioester hydrolase YkhA [Pullulanibacillus pueri]
MEKKYCKDSRVVKTSRVFPTHTNNLDSLFGGMLMSYIDDVASITAERHSRRDCVTASTDHVDFLSPITPRDSVCLESFVVSTGRTSMEVFVKVVAENLKTGDRRIAATSFLTFVALDENNKPVEVPGVIPESDEEKKLFEMAERRAEDRKRHRQSSKELAKALTTHKHWEAYLDTQINV